MTQLLLITQCTDKGSMVRAQYCSEWTELDYGMECLFDSFVLRWLLKAQPLLCAAIFRIWPRGTRTRVVWVYNPPQVLIIDWFLAYESDTSGSRPKVPLAVTCHIWRKCFLFISSFRASTGSTLKLQGVKETLLLGLILIYKNQKKNGMPFMADFAVNWFRISKSTFGH